MKMKHRALSILLSLAILLTFMPALTFAGSSDSTKAEAKKAIVSKQLERETGSKSKDRKDPDTQKGPAVKALNTSPEEEFDDDDEYFYGTYTGRPTMTTADWTDSDGELRYDFDIEPNSGDKITITTDEGTDEFVYLKDEDGLWYFEKPDDPDDWLSIGAIDADIEKTEAAFYVYNYVWDEEAEDYIDNYVGIVYLNRFGFKNTVSKIVFTPANINLIAENIIRYDELGMPYYSFYRRSKHSMNGAEWESSFAVGDKVTIYYVNGVSQTFTNKNLVFYDSDYDEYSYDDYFANGENYFWPYLIDDTLVKGSNTLTITWHEVKANINVKVETAAEKAAREKAEAERAAKAKAAAAALAKMKSVKTVTINKGTVSASSIRAAIAAAGGSKDYVTSIVIGKKVKKIKKGTFKGTKIKTVTLKTKKLKASSIKGAFKGSKVKTVKVKVGKSSVNKKYKAIYKKIFIKSITGRKTKVK